MQAVSLRSLHRSVSQRVSYSKKLRPLLTKLIETRTL
jgi:hypothetical protein